MLLTLSEKLILPDLTCWSDGENYFAECKRKKQWVKWEGRYETGLNQKHFNHYERLKAVTGQRVFLFFVQEDKNPDLSGVFFNEIHRLKPHARLWNGRKPNGDPVYVDGAIQAPLILFPFSELVRLREAEAA